MKLTFEIQDASENFLEEILLIQLGEKEFSYLIYDSANRCKALGAYQINLSDHYLTMSDDLKGLFLSHPLFSKVFHKIILVYNTGRNVLVPSEYSNADSLQNMIELVYGDVSTCKVLSDKVQKLEAFNHYAIEEQLIQAISKVFVCDLTMHQHSLLPAIPLNHHDQFYCIFGLGSFTVMVHKAGQFQFIQTFQFNVPEDVVYHLLHIGETYQFNIAEVQLKVSGYIDETSALYTELEKYFLNVEKDLLPDHFTYPEGMDKYPSHYFSYLFSLASCV